MAKAGVSGREAVDALSIVDSRHRRMLREEVKWNSPSFYTVDHFATFKLKPGDNVQVVLHMGAKPRSNNLKVVIEDPSGLLEWRDDNRCLVSFDDVSDLESKRAAFSAVLKQWVAQCGGG